MTLTFAPDAGPIADQLTASGLYFLPEDAARWEGDRVAIYRLFLHGYLTGKQVNAALEKLINAIADSVHDFSPSDKTAETEEQTALDMETEG